MEIKMSMKFSDGEVIGNIVKSHYSFWVSGEETSITFGDGEMGVEEAEMVSIEH